MSKWYPVPVSYRYRYRIYRTKYTFGIDSVPTFEIFSTGSVPVFTGFYPQILVRNRTIPYRVYSVPVPTFGDFRYRYFRLRTGWY
ncbi:hypothetical protein HanOQP8_Chr12g0462171 [Helianthus annuus]|nr:hypothetical protein HanOQP8_Chr12g0462171 [Helianthus annuus]